MKNFLLTCLIVYSSCFQYIWSQTDYPAGWVPSDISIPDSMFLFQEGAKFRVIPDKVDLTSYCPKPGKQSSPSCVTWSACYGALSTLKSINRQTKNTEKTTETAHSASFLFNHINSGNDFPKGVSIMTVLKLMKDLGVCLNSTFPNSKAWKEKAPVNAYQEAKRYKIKDYKFIFYQNYFNSTKIRNTKYSLAANRPVVVGFHLPVSFFKQGDLGNEIWKPNVDDEKGEILHAMTVVGYDNENALFLLMNSYGKDWGNEGFIHMSFQDFSKYALRGAVFSLGEPGEKSLDGPEILYGNTFSIMHEEDLVKDPNGKWVTIYYRPQVILDTLNLIYNLADTLWEVGKSYQIESQLVNDALFTSLISYDHLKRKYQFVHPNQNFPKNASDKSLILPSPNTYLYPEVTGKEYLVLILSNFKFKKEDLENIQKELHLGVLNFTKNLNGALKPWSTGVSNLFFEREKMQVYFECHEGDNCAVPLILEIKTK